MEVLLDLLINVGCAKFGRSCERFMFMFIVVFAGVFITAMVISDVLPVVGFIVFKCIFVVVG